ncbi:protein N-lysine methyltransferase METTL21A-like [Branchiostoma floridae x Branchiostoma belcheri]
MSSEKEKARELTEMSSDKDRARELTEMSSDKDRARELTEMSSDKDRARELTEMSSEKEKARELTEMSSDKDRARELMRKRCRMRPYHFAGREVVIWERDVGENSEEAIGKRIWPGGEAFAEYLESGEIFLEDKKVIELGAGTGLVGIVASLLGADVTITDLPDILPCTAENVTSNTMDGQRCICKYQPKVRPLTWGKNLAAFPAHGVHYDYVIGIEVVYIEEVFEDLIKTIKYLSDKDTRILIGYQIRVKERDSKFVRLFKEHFRVLKEKSIMGNRMKLLEGRLR